LRKHFLLLIVTSILLLSCDYLPTNTIAYHQILVGEATSVRSLVHDNYYISEIALSKDLQKYLYDICKEYDVPYIEALAIMTVENPTYNPETISKTNDYGLFQINIVNHKSLKEILKIDSFLNSYQNIKAGVYILSKLQSLDTHKRYMAYNMGVYGMKKIVSRGYSSTKYSRKVFEEWKKLNKLWEGK
jgi:soluble lytic murein transglycosylase-like protein